MRDENARRLIRNLRTSTALGNFANGLAYWLMLDSANQRPMEFAVDEGRSEKLMMVAGADPAELRDFSALIQRENSARIALYELLAICDLATQSGVVALTQPTSASGSNPINWYSLILAAFARRASFPFGKLDPASPPDPISPAGQVLSRSLQFVRRLSRMSPTEKDRLAAWLAPSAEAAANLDELTPDEMAPPLPPHYRIPVPERYPEMASETIAVDPDEPTAPPITLSEPVVITEDDLQDPAVAGDRTELMPPLSIAPGESSPAPPSPIPASGVLIPANRNRTLSALTGALRQRFRPDELVTTKLIITVAQFPDGPGLFGLQVRVRSAGIKSYVAGTTDRDGRFACELPVRIHSGLTYDVEVTWPDGQGGSVERKSVTLNADRTMFTLPFHRFQTSDDASTSPSA